MPTVALRASARRDLIEHFTFLAEQAGIDVADRFLAAAWSSFKKLAQQPRSGPEIRLGHAQLGGLRRWRIKGFENVLIFYLPRADGISVVRVLHGARNWWAILGLND
jgi:toxin ParE1/3/4